MTDCPLLLCDGSGWLDIADIVPTEPQRCPCGQAQPTRCPAGVCDGTGIIRGNDDGRWYDQPCLCRRTDAEP